MLEPLCNLTVNLAGDRGQSPLLQFTEIIKNIVLLYI